MSGQLWLYSHVTTAPGEHWICPLVSHSSKCHLIHTLPSALLGNNTSTLTVYKVYFHRNNFIPFHSNIVLCVLCVILDTGQGDVFWHRLSEITPVFSCSSPHAPHALPTQHPLPPYILFPLRNRLLQKDWSWQELTFRNVPINGFYVVICNVMVAYIEENTAEIFRLLSAATSAN